MPSGFANQLTKQRGEYLVAAELARRGLLVATFSGNVPDFDLLVLVVVVRVTQNKCILHPHERLVQVPAGLDERRTEGDAERAGRIGDVDRRAVGEVGVDRPAIRTSRPLNAVDGTT